jgi:periplasmic protein TonB
MASDQRSFSTQPAAIAAAVVLLHVGGLYALQTGLLHRAAELVVPVQMLSELMEPPQPVVQPARAQPKPTPEAQVKAAPKTRTPPPAPQLLAIKDIAPSPAASLGTTSHAPQVVDVTEAPVATLPAPVAAPAAAPPAPPAPAKVELPSSNADYLNNPLPAYPPVSKRLGETGKVIVRVYISTDGYAQKGEVRSSSGFERLDAAALAAALKWRYVPGKRGDVAEAMWVNVPISFQLD